MKNLKVSLADGVATLKGNAQDRAAAAKAIFMTGNVLGRQEVKADTLQAPPDALCLGRRYNWGRNVWPTRGATQ
jgi:hypothetical protein